MNDVNQPKHYCSHPSGIECIEITEHMNFCLGNAIKYIWRAGLKTEDPVKDLKKAAWYIEREIARLTEEERMDDEYYNAIHRAFGPDGWIRPNAGLKPSEPPKPDTFGRTGNEPLDMSAFVQETPESDAFYDALGEEAWDKPKADSDGWIPWSGGENPAPGETVLCRLKACEDDDPYGPLASEDVYWGRSSADEIFGGDVTAYKVVNNKEEN